jgi:hypothetical protein
VESNNLDKIITVGQKIRTEPRIYEIEVLELFKTIPEEFEKDFVSWLETRINEHGTGFNYDDYDYTDCYQDDIRVRFCIKQVGFTLDQLL